MVKLKDNKAITLFALSIYIIVLMVILGILATVTNFFNNNLNIIKEASVNASYFDKFNVSFVNDVKHNKEAKVEGNLIIFEDGTIYTYNENDNSIYRGKIKISENVKFFSATTKKILVDNVAKQIINVNIVIGESSNTVFDQNINYTLRYWE